jgi:uncharacterized glyoxalase superfamily protein PhnB
VTENDPPKGWPRLTVAVNYREAAKAIDWLCTAFGFEVKLRVPGPDGTIAHAELVFGGGMIMTGDAARREWAKSPRELGGASTASICLFVDDVDAHCERARAAGATIVSEPKTTDHGADYWADRSYEVADLEGHHWWFMQRVRG